MGLTRSSAQSHVLGLDGMTWHDFKIQDYFVQCSARERHDGHVAWLVSVSGWWTWVVGPSGRRLAGGAMQVKHIVRNLPLVSFRPFEQTSPKKALPGWSHLWATDQRWLLTSVARCDAVLKEVLTQQISSNSLRQQIGGNGKGAPNCLGTQYSYSRHQVVEVARCVRWDREDELPTLVCSSCTDSVDIFDDSIVFHSPISKVEKALTTLKVTRMAKVWVRAKVTKMAKGMSFGVMPKENAKDSRVFPHVFLSDACAKVFCKVVSSIFSGGRGKDDHFQKGKDGKGKYGEDGKGFHGKGLYPRCFCFCIC